MCFLRRDRRFITLLGRETVHSLGSTQVEKRQSFKATARIRRYNNVALRFNGSTRFTITPIYGSANRRCRCGHFISRTDRATEHQNQFVTIANGASPIGPRDSSPSRHYHLRSRNAIYPAPGNSATLITLGKVCFVSLA